MNHFSCQAMESDFFDTRQAFLSLCSGNHYQFDQVPLLDVENNSANA
jgi:hypothetical protein